MRLLFVSGGSGGHLAPLVAVERAVKLVEPKAETLFVCSQIDDDVMFLQKETEKYTTLPLSRHPLRNPIALLRSIIQARNILDAFTPDAIFSKGGIVSVPVCFVAHRRHIPIVLHESDAVMGRANRLIAKWAKVVCTGFPIKDLRYQISDISTNATEIWKLKSEISFVTGNPLRPHIADGSKKEGLRITGLSGTRPVLLVIGGSQGAQALNDAIVQNIDALLQHVEIIHLTGRGKKTSIQRDGYWQQEFSYTELPHLYAAADIALSRAGAGAIAELSANAIPTILVPIEGLANNHQFLNAIAAQENGACILLLQADLHAHLVGTVAELTGKPEQREEISRNMRVMAKPDAAGQIAKILLQCVAQRPASH